ncbi:hypothetical protein QO004_003710 [Rhizobium mesoamericanum]|uniref:hypothetical protein n=1 Tax=Rhizobium mesoamericanum TaxID=1079800 RepID=UPI00278AC059|nr:hypothetical protein [Rhizobium mesoamericanum]MDQ0561909.1 hypothetical protein [Rhizobium mesoamericanum]
MMIFPTFHNLENGELDAVTTVIKDWCTTNQVDPESECARSVTAIAVDLMEAGFTSRESQSSGGAGSRSTISFIRSRKIASMSALIRDVGSKIQ